jgi:hypothetical protein
MQSAERPARPQNTFPMNTYKRWPTQVALTARDLLRRPLLLLTIEITCALLLGALNQAHEATRVEAQTAQTQAQNERLNHQIMQIDAIVARLAQNTIIIAEAERLGWTFDTP